MSRVILRSMYIHSIQNVQISLSTASIIHHTCHRIDEGGLHECHHGRSNGSHCGPIMHQTVPVPRLRRHVSSRLAFLFECPLHRSRGFVSHLYQPARRSTYAAVVPLPSTSLAAVAFRDMICRLFPPKGFSGQAVALVHCAIEVPTSCAQKGWVVEFASLMSLAPFSLSPISTSQSVFLVSCVKS
jgi:hypothetical protein